MMNRERIKLIGVIVILFTFLNGNPAFPKSKKDSSKPNLVFVFADQLRHDVLGYAGDKKAITPNIDKLSKQGIVFTNAVAVSPVCAPMRASLFTGKYTSSTGMVINKLRLNPNQKAFAHVLNDNGYETSYIGKWHLYGTCSDHHNTECAYIHTIRGIRIMSL